MRTRTTTVSCSAVGARMYDASLGRWNSVDPQGFRKAKINNYIYCKNNPIIFFDPDGQDDWYVNSEGYMTRKPNTSHDAFYMINDKGNVMDNNGFAICYS